MKQQLDIHLEGMDDKGEKLKLALDLGIPCAISTAPYTLREGWYNDCVLGLVEAIVKNNGIAGQQGNYHKCLYPHRIADPWHENHCLYNPPVSFEKQLELMEKGKETIVEYFGVRPNLYVPPNHQFDETTLSVAESMGYNFFAEAGIINSFPYQRGRMIVLPETKIWQNGNICYIHYDEIRDMKKFEALLKRVSPFSEIKSKEVSRAMIDVNRNALRAIKYARDIKRLLLGVRGK